MCNRNVAIGIDLGTSKCCLAVVREGKVEIVENERANKTTPSYVAFTDTERLVGEDAKDQVTLNPTNSVFGVKGLIGRNYKQALAHCQDNSFPYKLENDNGKPRIKVKYLRMDVSLAPEQISAMLLSKMKKLAESYLDCTVSDAVISVPAYFNNSQRLATKAAAEIAGLKVLKLINETTAAAVAFKVSRASVKKETIVMVDIGGGTFDAAVIRSDKGSVEVVRAEGNANFGGQCFDHFLIDHFVNEFRQKHGRNLTDHKKAMERLRVVCSKMKHTLTLLPKVCHTIECILGEIDFDVQMTRTAFENMFVSFIKQKVTPVLNFFPMKVVLNADHVVAIGGSTRVPKIQAFLKNYFEKNLTKTINIDEAVAYGAAFQAALLSGDNTVQDLKIYDQTPHIIDVIPTWQPILTLIPRSDKIVERPITADVLVNGETTFCEFVYNADRKATEYNILGTTSVGGAQAFSKQAKPVSIRYEIDGSGIFHVEVANQPTKSHVANLRLENIHPNDVENMRKLEEQFEEQQQLRLKQMQAFSDLEKKCFQLHQKLRDIRSSTSGDYYAEATQTCNDVLEFLDDNPDASLEELLQHETKLKKFMSFG